MTDQINDLWGPLDITNWRETPCIRGRVATKDDVDAGLAVFYIINPSQMKPLDVRLPACAIHMDLDTQKRPRSS